MARNKPEDAHTAPAMTSASNPHGGGAIGALPGMHPGISPIMLGGASGAPPEAGGPQLVNASPITGSVFDPSKDPGPKPRRYRVLNGGSITWRGNRTVIRAGKELDDRNYNVADLKRQGIRLEEIKDEPPPEETADAG